MSRRAWIGPALLLLAGCMEQPKPKPLPRTPSLYTRLGGSARLEKIADAFVAEVQKTDAVREPIKEAFREDPEARQQALVHHLGAACGGPQEPSPRGLLAAFDGVPIDRSADL